MAKQYSFLKEASADDPIYTRGFVVGARRSTSSSNATPATNSPSENENPISSSNLPPELEEWISKGIYEAAAHQMSTDYPSEKTDESPSSTSADGKD